MERVRAGLDAGLWRELTELGVFDLPVVETALLFEELGRALVPGPFVGAHLLPDRGMVAVVDARTGPLLVAHLASADTLVVLGDAGIGEVPAAAVPATAVPSVDPLTPLHRLTALPRVSWRGGPALSAAWRRTGALLTAATQVGIAGAVLDRSVRYARQREQFGRPVGAFQAVKHLLAEMAVRLELARAAVHAAAVAVADAVADAADDVESAVCAAKLLADEAAVGNARDAVQAHGGVGFTWELDLHLYLKRAWVHAAQFGTAEECAERLAHLLV
ncbi:acyl-CoA dehydrogenase [Solihabitans fulvus]|uniref:Acyl-CoA dehydrogenase n=2 Tax=Solihabitans fulvus TaxID=1892852 RepID=A0A5B2XDB5_9PSEU|nr:acyl-CoA dehydrogenase [Solihabitans fulvus]